MIYFQGHPAVRPELDLMEEKYSHDISIDDEINPETSLGKLGNSWFCRDRLLFSVSKTLLNFKKTLCFFFCLQMFSNLILTSLRTKRSTRS